MSNYCKFCGEEVEYDGQGSWYDSTDGDGCDNEESGVHEVDLNERTNPQSQNENTPEVGEKPSRNEC